MSQDTGGKLIGGVAWGVGGAAGQALFQLLVFVVLARTLSPAAFGIVAIATAVIDLLNFVGRGGITEVLVQRETLDTRTLNAGFFASLISGAVLTLAVFLSAPLLAIAFSTPELRSVMTLLAPICVVYAAGAVYEGLLRHAFQFKQLALRNASAVVVSGMVALVMAFNGMGVYALIAQRLISSIWSLAAMVIATRWLPSFEFEPRSMIVQLRQGSAMALSSVLGAGNQRIVDLVVGFFLGPVRLGYLRIAWRMLDLVNEIVVRPIGNVALTSLPKAKHAGRSVEDEYIGLLRYASIFIMPMFLGCSAIASDLVPLMFGEQWRMSGKLLSILCFVGLFMPLTNFKSSALIAQGAYRHVFYLNLAEFMLSVLCAIAFSPFGLISATTGNVVRAVLATVLSFVYLERVGGISSLRSLRAGLPAAISACWMLTFTFGLGLALPPATSPYVRLLVLVFGGSVSYGAAIFVTDRRLLADVARRRARA